MSHRAQLYEYKGNRCASCGLSIAEMIERYGTFNRMFQFHHVDPDTKDRHYKRLMAQRLNRKQMDEIDKCVLLCTECHGIVHAQNIKASLELTVEFQRRTIKQHFQGWVRADKVDRSLTFITNEHYLLELCELRLGNRDPQPIFLVEVEQHDNLQRWLSEIERHRTLEIRSLRSPKRFMRVEHLHGHQISVTQSLGLPITALDLYPIDRPKEVAYFRNGFFLSATGEIHSEGQMSYRCTLNLPASRRD